MYAYVRFEEHIVYAKAMHLVLLYAISHLIGGISVARSVLAHETPLLHRVVRSLTLIEVHTSALSFPKCLVLLEMLVEEAIDGNVITLDIDADRTGVYGPSRTFLNAMVSTPYPEMVTYDIVSLDLNGAIHMDWRREEASHTEEEVCKQSRVVLMAFLASFDADERA